MPVFYPMTKEEYEMAISHYFKDEKNKLENSLKSTVNVVELDRKRKVLHLINFKDEDMVSIVQVLNNKTLNITEILC